MTPLYLPYPDTGATYDPPPDLALIDLSGVPKSSAGWECEIYNSNSYHIPIAYAVTPPYFVLKNDGWYVQQAFIDNVEITSGFIGERFVNEQRNGFTPLDPTFSITVGADIFPWTLIDGAQRQEFALDNLSQEIFCPLYATVPFQSPNFSLPLAEWTLQHLYPPVDQNFYIYETWQDPLFTLGLWERRPVPKGPGCAVLSTIGKLLIAMEGS